MTAKYETSLNNHLDTVIRVTLLNPNTFEKQDLYYRLFNIPLAKKWLEHFQKLKNNHHWFRERKVHFKSGSITPSIINEFNSCIDTINTFYDKPLPQITELTHDILNNLHEAYAVYGERLKEKLETDWWGKVIDLTNTDCTLVFSTNTDIKKINSYIKEINKFYDIHLTQISNIDEEKLTELYNMCNEYLIRHEEKINEEWWNTAYLKIKNDAPEAGYWPGITFNDTMHDSFIKLKEYISNSCVWPGISFNESMHSGFVKLNNLIHKVELYIDTAQIDNPGFLILASYEPRENFELEKEDLPCLKSFLDFGDFCLGYNTLGKNLRHIVLDGDRQSLENNLITPQTTWSNEIQIHMKHSDNHSNSFQDYYDQWNAIGTDEFGFEFGDFYKNREGYFCIGELVNYQKEKFWDLGSNNLKVDLSQYESIYDISPVTVKQFYLERDDPSVRFPNWKALPATNGKKIIKIQNNNTAIVTWVLNDICNYACRYCPPSLHNGKNYKNIWDTVQPFVDYVIDMYSADGRKVIFSLSGGEPTLSPFFPDLVKKIYEKGHYTRVTSNLARTTRFIEEHFKYLLGASCSFHPAQEFPNNTVEEYIEKVKVSDQVTYTTVRVMMDPLHWDQCIEFIERLKNETAAGIEIVMIEDQYGSTKTKLCEINYTTEQLEFFKLFKTIHARNNPLRNRIVSDFRTNIIMKYEDGSDVNQSEESCQKLINNGQTLFYDYNCSIGKESMFIHQSGNIRKGNCHVGGTHWGNIANWKDVDWDAFRQDLICTTLKCHCGADVPISKYKL